MTETPADSVHVDPWPSEVPLQSLAALVSVLIWLLLVVSIIGILYALVLGMVFFVAHLMLVAHIRGNGVRLGPTQFPELHQMVERLSSRIGLRVPEAYLMQGGGTLNAFATRFLSADIVVLYSDLISACGDNPAACEMIVGHELGHVKRGHLRWHWLLLPAFLVPFLGTALSRAREYTCDRYGRALAGNTEGALLGLTILAAGGTHGPHVNREALVAQQLHLNTGLMRLAEWLSTHPPLASRLAELNPALLIAPVSRRRGTLRALVIVGAMLLPFFIAGVGAAVLIPMLSSRAALQQQVGAEPAEVGAEPAEDVYEPPPADVADSQVTEDFERIVAFLKVETSAGRTLPLDGSDLYKRWRQVRRYEFAPSDPFDGGRYGYQSSKTFYVLWSSGADGRSDTGDDIFWDSRAARRSTGRRPEVSVLSQKPVATALPVQ